MKSRISHLENWFKRCRIFHRAVRLCRVCQNIRQGCKESRQGIRKNTLLCTLVQPNMKVRQNG